MRCDWPVGFNEDCTDPACELYLQLFIENPEIGGEIVLAEEDILPLIQLAPAISDGESDHGEDFLIDYNVDEASSDLLSVNSDLSMHIVSVTSDTSSESSDSDVETPEDFPGVELQHEEISASECVLSVVSNSTSEVSICEAETQEVLSGAELHCKETSSKLSDEEASKDTWLPEENNPVEGGFHEDDSQTYLELDCSPLSEQVDEVSSNVPYENNDNCDTIPTLSNELPKEGEPSQEIEQSSDSSSTSTHVSLFVVVPPTNFSKESSDNILPAHSSDNLFSELLPIDTPCSSESLDLDKETVQSNNSDKICTSEEEMVAFDKSSACNITPTRNDCQNSNNIFVPDLIAVNSDCQVSHKISENYEVDFGSSGSVSNESANTSLFFENEACSEILTDKHNINKKRKVSTASDDGMINKVPKYSSETSTDSVNVQETVESYCKTLTCNSDKQTSNDGAGADMPPAVPGENVILTLGKAVEESSVTNETPKSR